MGETYGLARSAMKRTADAVRWVERQALRIPTVNQRPVMRNNGGSFLAICTGCTRDTYSGSTVVTAKKLTAIPGSYTQGDEVTAWGGVYPILRPGMTVIIVPIAAPADSPTISSVAIPMLAANPHTLEERDFSCLTEFTGPCVAIPDSEVCFG